MRRSRLGVVRVLAWGACGASAVVFVLVAVGACDGGLVAGPSWDAAVIPDGAHASAVDAAGAIDGSGGDDASSSDAAPADAGIGVNGVCRGVPLPANEHYVAPGMCARLVGRGQGQLRQITFAPNGDLFGTIVGGNIRRYRDVNGDGVYDTHEPETVEWANTGGNGNNCHVDGNFLYAGTPTGVKRWPYAATSDTGGAGEDVVVGEPGDGNHPFHTLHVYDGKLYVQVGSHDNVSDPMSPAYDTERSLIKRFDLAAFTPGTPFDWSSGEVFTVGLRNTVGFGRDEMGRIYGVVNGQDSVTYGGVDVHNDNPGEQIVRLDLGKQYGYPFCFTAARLARPDGGLFAPGTQVVSEIFPSPADDAWCAANSSPPTTFVQAHSAPLDITFFDHDDAALPARWRRGAFVTFHGSWDRSPPTGYKVVWVPFDASGNAPMPTLGDAGDTIFPYETVFGGGDTSGPKDGPWTWSGNGAQESPRPVGVAISPIDGGLYVSTTDGMIYRLGLVQ